MGSLVTSQKLLGRCRHPPRLTAAPSLRTLPLLQLLLHVHALPVCDVSHDGKRVSLPQGTNEGASSPSFLARELTPTRCAAASQVYDVFDWHRWRAVGAYAVLPVALFIAWLIWTGIAAVREAVGRRFAIRRWSTATETLTVQERVSEAQMQRLPAVAAVENGGPHMESANATIVADAQLAGRDVLREHSTSNGALSPARTVQTQFAC